MNRWAMVAALGLVLAAAGVAWAAASDVMLHPDVTINVDIPKFGLVLPSNNGTWSFTLTSTDNNPAGGFDFTATEASGTYFLKVYSNTDVTVSLDDGVITVGDTDFYPVYTWALASGGGTLLNSSYTAEAPGTPVNLYLSGTAKNGAQINLTGFSVNVTDITTFTPGTASGTLVLTVAAS